MGISSYVESAEKTDPYLSTTRVDVFRILRVYFLWLRTQRLELLENARPSFCYIFSHLKRWGYIHKYTAALSANLQLAVLRWVLCSFRGSISGKLLSSLRGFSQSSSN